MRKALAILAPLLFIYLTANARFGVIDIKETLDSAKHIQTIVVYGYADTTIFYGVVGTKDTVRAHCPFKRESEGFRQALIKDKIMSETELAGTWPQPGDTVLMVINQQDRMLFAYKQSDKYRFWDSNYIPFAESLFTVPQSDPAFFSLSDCGHPHFMPDTETFFFCRDGCLVLASYIKER